MTPNKFLTACVDDKTDLACKRARADCTTTNTHIQLNATHTHTHSLFLSRLLRRGVFFLRAPSWATKIPRFFPQCGKMRAKFTPIRHAFSRTVITKKHTLERRAGGEREFSTEENAIQWQQQQAHTRQGRSDRRERTSRRKTVRTVLHE